jgi:hypothetical protein
MVAIVIAVSCCVSHTWAVPNVKQWPVVDTTLEYYLSRSDAVVECTVTQCKIGPMDATGLVYFECDVVVSNAIMGELKADEPLHILVTRWQQHDKTLTPGPTPGKRYIVFLKDKRLADMWFGIQPYDELMAGRLKVVVANQKKDAAPTKPSTPTK